MPIQCSKPACGPLQLRYQIDKEAEKAKRLLSHKTAADLHVKQKDGTVLQTTITRADFEEGCKELFDRIPQVPLQILADKGLQPSDVNILLAVGGSSYMPRVRELHRDVFPEADMPAVDGNFDPELAVVHGASLCAEYLVKDPSLLPMDVIPLSLGLPEMQPVQQLFAESKSGSGVRLSAFPEMQALSEFTPEFQVGVQVHPPTRSGTANAAQPELPSNIFLAVDVSASMKDLDASGKPKLQSVIEALLEIIARATSSMSLHICTFSNTACEQILPLTIMDTEGKQHASTLVQGLSIMGSTNMAAGIRQSAAEIAKHVRESNLRQATMIIFTDGLPNSRPEASQALRKAVNDFKQTDVSFAVSTFGFGHGGQSQSLDGELLQSMAELGGGHYYYVQEGDNVDAVFMEIIGDAQKARFDLVASDQKSALAGRSGLWVVLARSCMQVVARHVRIIVNATGKFMVNAAEMPSSCMAPSTGVAGSIQCTLKDVSTFSQELLFSLVPGGAASDIGQITFTLQFTDATNQIRDEIISSLHLNISGTQVMNSQKVLDILCRMKVDDLRRRAAWEEAKARASLCSDASLRQTIERDEILPDEERLSKVSLMDKKKFSEASDRTSEVQEVMHVVVPRHSLYPMRRSTVLQTFQDGQTQAWIRVYEGEDLNPAGNHRIGDFSLTGIPPRPAGSTNIKVTFAIDDNGILTVARRSRSLTLVLTIAWLTPHFFRITKLNGFPGPTSIFLSCSASSKTMQDLLAG